MVNRIYEQLILLKGILILKPKKSTQFYVYRYFCFCTFVNQILKFTTFSAIQYIIEPEQLYLITGQVHNLIKIVDCYR